MPLFHWLSKKSEPSVMPTAVAHNNNLLTTVELDSAVSFARMYANNLLGSASHFQPFIDQCLATNASKYAGYEHHYNPDDPTTGPSWASPELVKTLGMGDFMYRGSGGERDQLVIDAFREFTERCQLLARIGEAKTEDLRYLQALDLMGNILNFVMYSEKLSEVLNSKDTDPVYYNNLLDPTEHVYESQSNHTLGVLAEITSRQSDDPRINQILTELKAIATKIERTLPPAPDRPSIS
jgi:hypothetical protein